MVVRNAAELILTLVWYDRQPFEEDPSLFAEKYIK